MSRVRTLDSLTLWDYTPFAIKIAPYYKQLLQWCDSVDVIRSPPYDGPPVRYPDRQHDQVSCAAVDEELNNILDTACLSSVPIKMIDANNTIDESSNDNTVKPSKCRSKPADSLQSKRKCVRKNSVVKNVSNTRTTKKSTTKKATITLANIHTTKGSTLLRNKNNKHKKCVQNDCTITDVENVVGPNRTVWPEYRYYQTNVTWQQGACTRLGVRFIHPTGFQPGGPDVILTQPDLRSLRNVQGDGNCLFRALSYVVTGSEAQHMEILNGIISYMLSIEPLLAGYDSTGHANYLVPFNFSTVQQYINNSDMARSGTWGTDLEMICFCHMFSVNLYSFQADSNTWALFSPVNIERGVPRVYNIMSVYLCLRRSHFYVVASIRRM